MKFVSVALLATLFCAAIAAPSTPEPTFEDSTEIAEFRDIVEFGAEKHLKCLIDAISETVQDTDLEIIWIETQNSLLEILAKLKACLDKGGVLKVSKCVIKESFLANKAIYKFLQLVAMQSADAYLRLWDNMKKCHQQPMF